MQGLLALKVTPRWGYKNREEAQLSGPFAIVHGAFGGGSTNILD
jgi:hypothetical protein